MMSFKSHLKKFFNHKRIIFNVNYAVAIERSNPDIELWEDDTIVGRGDANGNKGVSKFHCRIFKNSSGKIFVNNFRLVICLVLLTKLKIELITFIFIS